MYSSIGEREQWASYQIRKIAGCACAGNAGNVFPRRRFQRKPLVSDPGMHHGTCVTHVPWCMSGSRTRGGGENVPGIPGACAPAISRIWQEAHAIYLRFRYIYTLGIVNGEYIYNWDFLPHFIVTCSKYQMRDIFELLHFENNAKARKYWYNAVIVYT